MDANMASENVDDFAGISAYFPLKFGKLIVLNILLAIGENKGVKFAEDEIWPLKINTDDVG